MRRRVLPWILFILAFASGASAGYYLPENVCFPSPSGGPDKGHCDERPSYAERHGWPGPYSGMSLLLVCTSVVLIGWGVREAIQNLEPTRPSPDPPVYQEGGFDSAWGVSVMIVGSVWAAFWILVYLATGKWLTL